MGKLDRRLQGRKHDRSRDGGELARRPGVVRLHQQRGAAGHRHRPRQLLGGRRQGRHRSGPQNQDLLARRDDLQAQIDKWHRQHVIEPIDPDGYKQFLTEIGYLQPEPDDFTITTAGVDDEITTTAGPQLVVPILNARFALNAANARWGSLYDALYGTDVIPEDDGAEKGKPATPATTRCAATRSSPTPRKFLDGAVPLASGVVDRGDRAEDRRRPAVDHPRRRPVDRAWRRPSSSSATPASSARPSGPSCWRTTACTSRS